MWVLKRTVSMRRFLWVLKTYGKIDEKGNIYNFFAKHFAYLDLYVSAELTNRLLLCLPLAFLRCPIFTKMYMQPILDECFISIWLYQLEESISNTIFVGC